jgi:hypothetical protein
MQLRRKVWFANQSFQKSRIPAGESLSLVIIRLKPTALMKRSILSGSSDGV